MSLLVSIDPGLHVGYAVWDLETRRCLLAVEHTPETLHAALQALDVGDVDHIVYEQFNLRPGKAALRQVGSVMPAAEAIGIVKAACWTHGLRAETGAAGQGATIQRLTAAGYRWVSRGHGGHAKDAEALGVAHMRWKLADLGLHPKGSIA